MERTHEEILESAVNNFLWNFLPLLFDFMCWFIGAVIIAVAVFKLKKQMSHYAGVKKMYISVLGNIFFGVLVLIYSLVVNEGAEPSWSGYLLGLISAILFVIGAVGFKEFVRVVIASQPPENNKTELTQDK